MSGRPEPEQWLLRGRVRVCYRMDERVGTQVCIVGAGPTGTLTRRDPA